MNSTQVDNHCRLAKRVSRAVRHLPRIGDDEDGIATYGQVAALYAAIVHACAEIVQHCAGACQKIDDIPSRVPESEIEVAIIWREVADRAMDFLGTGLIDWNESSVFGNSVRLLPQTDHVEEISFWAGLVGTVAKRAMLLETPTEPQESPDVAEADQSCDCLIWPSSIGTNRKRLDWFKLYDHLQAMSEKAKMDLRYYGVTPCALPDLPAGLHEANEPGEIESVDLGNQRARKRKPSHRVPSEKNVPAGNSSRRKRKSDTA